MPTDGPARPHPKDAQLARGERRYRRKVASAKGWQRILAEKVGPCRSCGAAAWNGGAFPRVQMHHLVARVHGGDDVPENIVPLCLLCHDKVTRRMDESCRLMLASLTDAEYAYAVQRGGEDYFERAYGIDYARGGTAG